jgi:TRAP-type mannitol/chloroaromatic compound transport system permease large subunit
LKTIYLGMADFMVIQAIALAVLLFYPDLALWFPRWLFSN